MILVAWAATVYVVLAYVYLARTGNPRPFHWSNVIGASILAPMNLLAGMPPQALLNAVFGLVALVALIQTRRARRGS